MSKYSQSFKEGFYNFLELIIAVGTTILFMLLVFSCNTVKDLTIPEEPTVWIISFVHHDAKNPLPNGMVAYKVVPVNPGSIKARATWKLDYPGKYHVGQIVDFAPIVKTNAAGPR